MMPPDAAQREQALDTHASFIVEAPAGSGKTALLIQRFLNLLLDEEVSTPAQVLAITFTNKAAQEIRLRVVRALQRAAEGVAAANAYEQTTLQLAAQVHTKGEERGWNLLEMPSTLNIRTIDSLAAEIARSVPIFSGGVGNNTPTEDANDLHRKAARRVLHRLGGDDAQLNRDLETVLLHRDAKLGDVERLLAGMLAQRDQWMQLVPLTGEELTDDVLEAQVLPRLNHVLEMEVHNRLERLVNLLPTHLHSALSALTRAVCECETSVDTHPLNPHWTVEYGLHGTATTDLAAWQAFTVLFLTNDGSIRKPGGINKSRFNLIDAPAAMVQMHKQLVSDLASAELEDALVAVRTSPPAEYPAKQWRLVKPLLRLLRHALAELEVLFAEESACDFTAIQIAAQQALQREDGPTEYAIAMGTALRHLVMDEMQDTSASQYRLLRALTESWDGSSQTVFFVGDPKQSIYSFREARVELFVRMMSAKRFGDIALHPLQLTANFRSQQTLVEDFNLFFPQIFHAGSSIPYNSVEWTQTPTDEHLHWHAATQDSSISGKQQYRNWEAASIADRITEWQAANPVSKTGIAILVRQRSHAEHILRELYARGIPVRAAEMDSLADRREVLDLVALTRALLHPADGIAWLAVLRAPWCGCSLSGLYQLTQGDSGRLRKEPLLNFVETSLVHLQPEDRRRVERALQVLQHAVSQQGRTGLARWIEHTWRELGGERYLDASALDNCLLYLSMLEEMEGAGQPLSVAQIEEKLKRLRASAATVEGAVTIMTMHGAKGLEWDLVFVPQLHRKGASDAARLLDWSEVLEDREDYFPLLAPIQERGDNASHLNLYLQQQRTQRSLDELQRLLYVAGTRARRELHLYGAVTPTSTGALRATRGTLLHTAWQAAEPHFHSPEKHFDGSGSVSTMHGAAHEVAGPMTVWRAPEMPPFAVPVSDETARAAFERPEGNTTVRAVGSVVHTYLEALTRSAQHTSLQVLKEQVATWPPRIQRYAQMLGLDTGASQHALDTTMAALHNMLSTQTGRWILAPHAQGAVEMEVLLQREIGDIVTLRLDRTFVAGAEPETTSDTHRWIIDFKTNRSMTDAATFEQEQRQTYGAQLATYAKALQRQGENAPIMLALYYPLLNHLIAWPYIPAV